ncbi:MAG: Spy/CpxP family protein refolding chaperone [Parasulfuritortus sp.]|nr:Spy/CpxP family protein refolding chaperone [Parasulfuritortus sp.]
MITPRLGLSHSLAAIVLSATMFGTAAPAFSEENPNAVQASSRQAHKQVWLRFALDKMAERLEIKASQMHAWKAYEAAVEATPDAMAKQPPRDADAARMIQFRADRVNEMGAKLNAIAKATENLQAVLSPEQREVLNEIVRDNLMRPHFERHQDWGRDHSGQANEHDRPRE